MVAAAIAVNSTAGVAGAVVVTNGAIMSTVGKSALSSGLPVGWSSAVDPASRLTYYYQPATGVTQWQKP